MNRREFMASAAALAALGSTRAFAAASTVRGVKIGLITGSLKPWPKTPGKDDADIVVDVPVERNLVVAAVRGKAQQLAAGRLSRNHVVCDSELERMGLVRHGRRKLSTGPKRGKSIQRQASR